jgi:hypothetical protein
VASGPDHHDVAVERYREQTGADLDAVDFRCGAYPGVADVKITVWERVARVRAAGAVVPEVAAKVCGGGAVGQGVFGHHAAPTTPGVAPVTVQSQERPYIDQGSRLGKAGGTFGRTFPPSQHRDHRDVTVHIEAERDEVVVIPQYAYVPNLVRETIAQQPVAFSDQLLVHATSIG